MNNAKRLTSNVIVNRVVKPWSRSHWLHAFKNTYSHKPFGVLMSISISTMLLISLISCNKASAGTQTQSGPSLTPLSRSSYPMPISGRNMANISSIGEWRIYDINAIAWSSLDGSAFAVAGQENNDEVDFGVYAYDINSSEKMWFSEVYVPFSLSYNPDNQTVAVPYFAGISLLDAATGKGVKGISDQNDCFGDQEIKFSPDGTKLFTLGIDAKHALTTSIYIWDVVTDQCLGTLPQENGVAFDFELSGDGQLLVVGLRDIRDPNNKGKFLNSQVHVWNVETRQRVCNFDGSAPVAFSLDGSTIAAANVDDEGAVDLWDAKSCQLLDSLHRKEQKTFSMDFSPDGKLLAVGGNDTLQIWDVATKKLLFESEKLPNEVNLLAFSPDGRYLLSKTDRTSFDGKAIITLWGVATP